MSNRPINLNWFINYNIDKTLLLKLKKKQITYIYDNYYYYNRPYNDIIGILINSEETEWEIDNLKIKVFNGNEWFKIIENHNKKNDIIFGTLVNNIQKKEIQEIYKKLKLICANNIDGGSRIKKTDDSFINLEKKHIQTYFINQLLYLERYNVDQKTFLIIPSNHKFLWFPYNIFDYSNEIIKKLTHYINNNKFDIDKIKINKTISNAIIIVNKEQLWSKNISISVIFKDIWYIPLFTSILTE